jgi:voltage-gated potassium channel
MTLEPTSAVRRLDRHWLRSIGFTLALVALVVAGIGADWSFAVAALATCAIGFGFFYVFFPGGMHFGITVANLLAFYACMFVFFHDANFPAAPRPFVTISFLLPVIGYLGGCFLQRRRIGAMMLTRRSHAPRNLPRLSRWVPGTAIVGTVSFAMPELGLDPLTQGIALTVSMTVVAAFVGFAVRDVVRLQMDIATIFEGVTARLTHLLMPIVAFLMLYSLLVVVFGCLYRIADRYIGLPQFMVHGIPAPLAFTDALYFSVITLSTLGYGDIVPATSLVRALSALEVIFGMLMLLFGFSEIMRAGRDTGPGTDAEIRARARARGPQE